MPRTQLAPQWAFLTLTFDARHHHHHAKTLFDRTLPWILKRINRVSPKYWRICPELTDKGILHYHILIHTHQFVRRAAFLNCWKARYGNHDTTGVHNQLGLLVYMRKQNKEIQHILNWPFRLMVMREFTLPIINRILQTRAADKSHLARQRAAIRFFGPVDRFFARLDGRGELYNPT